MTLSRVIAKLRPLGKRHERTPKTAQVSSCVIEADLAAACAWGVPFSVAFPDIAPPSDHETTVLPPDRVDANRAPRAI